MNKFLDLKTIFAVEGESLADEHISIDGSKVVTAGSKHFLVKIHATSAGSITLGVGRQNTDGTPLKEDIVSTLQEIDPTTGSFIGDEIDYKLEHSIEIAATGDKAYVLTYKANAFMGDAEVGGDYINPFLDVDIDNDLAGTYSVLFVAGDLPVSNYGINA